MSFSNYFQLFSHKSAKMQCITESRYCEMCEEPLSPQLVQQHLEKHAENQKFHCSFCDVDLIVTSIQFMEHLKMHLSSKFYLCSDCGEYFLKKIHLEIHFSVHRFEENSIAKDFFMDENSASTEEVDENKSKTDSE